MAVSILVLYDAKSASIEELAAAAARGAVDSGLPDMQVIASVKKCEDAGRADLIAADGIMLGSPNWSGVTGSMKEWLDSQGDLWEERALAGRPGAAFTSGTGRHSGLEMTLLQLVHWMLACGNGRGGTALVGPDASLRLPTTGPPPPAASPATTWLKPASWALGWPG